MTSKQLTAKRVAELATELSGMSFDSHRVRCLLRPYRARALGAIASQDGRALAAVTALGAMSALAEAAYAGEFNGPQLTDHVRVHGWTLIDAVLAGAPGAHEALYQAQRDTGARNMPEIQQRPCYTPTHAPAVVRRPATLSAHVVSMQPPRRHDTSNVVTIWAVGVPRPSVSETSTGITRAVHESDPAIDAGAEPAPLAIGSPGTSSVGPADLGIVERASFPKQARAWGKQAALNVEASTTRAGEPTVVIEAARAMGSDGGYDWGKKLVLQLTPAELQLATALFLGLVEHPVEGRNHGPGHNKWFSMERQVERFAGTYKVALGDGRDTLIVQIAADAKLGSVIALLAKQCAAQMDVDLSDLATLLRPVAAAYNMAHAAAKGRNEGRRAG